MSTKQKKKRNKIEKKSMDLRINKKLSKEQIIIVVVVVLSILFLAILMTIDFKRKINVDDYVGVVYDNHTYETDVEYISQFNEYNETYDYTDRINDLIEYGYSEEEISKYFPTSEYEEVKDTIDKLDFKVNLSNNKDVHYGDVVNVSLEYNEKQADKNNIIIENSSFDIIIDRLKHSVEINDINYKEFDEEVESYLLENISNSIDYDSSKLKGAYYYTNLEEVEKSHIIFEYEINGKKTSLFSVEDIKNAYVDVEVYMQNDKIYLDFDNIQLVYDDEIISKNSAILI